jgi:hypothetical protein
VVKLFNNATAKRQPEAADYNPAYKYNFIFDTIIHNVNSVTRKAGLDLCGDETTYGHQGFGERGSGILTKIQGKPGITKGMQSVIVTDCDRIRPTAYLHRHKKHRQIFRQQGPNEVALLWEEQLRPLLSPDNKYNRALFQSHPHMTWDNYFSGDEVMYYAAEQGFGFTTTIRRDRLPRNVPGKYWHKEKTQPNAQRPKSARFLQPIVATKHQGEIRLTVTSFQSTSSCNITSVNGISACSLYAHTKERGQSKLNMKRKWAIEMNEARELYLRTYGAVDRIDHLIKNCKMTYRSWKYWHSAMIHGKRLAVTVAYDMYLECAEGMLEQDWKVRRPVDFHRFREKLAIQMLQYSPKNNIYPGDDKFRVSTQVPKKKRRRTSISVATDQAAVESIELRGNGLIGREALEGAQGHLCGFLDDLLLHEQSVEQFPNRGHQVCACCGKPTYTRCMKCPGNPAFHLTKPKGRINSCFIHYHNTSSFGLWRSDYRYTGQTRSLSSWQYPDAVDLDQHS